MKKIFFLMVLLLSLPFAVGEYETILNGPGVLVDGALLHIQVPTIVYEGSSFEIIVIPVREEEFISTISLYKDGNLLPTPAPKIVEISGESRAIIVWQESLVDDATYRIEYKREDGETWRSLGYDVAVEEKVVVHTILHENVYFPSEKTDNQRKKYVELMNEGGFDYTLDQFIEEEEAAKELLDLKKTTYIETLVYNDNSTENHTVVVIDISSDEALEDVKIIEFISKEFAFDVDELYFDVKPLVLERDPIVMWHLEDVDEQRIQYQVDGDASVTGNTILLTGVIKDVEVVVDEESSSSFSKALLPLLLIPLVAGILIFFSKFSTPKKKRR